MWGYKWNMSNLTHHLPVVKLHLAMCGIDMTMFGFDHGTYWLV